MRKKRRDLGQSSDIAFLLIIFFLLLSGISSSHSISLDLPSSTSARTSAEEITNQTLSLGQDGSLSLADQIITTNQLPSLVTNSTHLTLQVEADTAWQHVVSTLSMLQQREPASLELEMML
ncbi:MAG: hypothetical protein EOM68_28360 [Spirochaetia bacterium]|nr:hypothetical protein [Spirochaetia bacterium]